MMEHCREDKLSLVERERESRAKRWLLTTGIRNLRFPRTLDSAVLGLNIIYQKEDLKENLIFVVLSKIFN